jgi:hypothetical protein
MQMALTLATTMRDAIADAVDARIGTSATLEFQTSGNAEVATLTLGNPAFDAAGSAGGNDPGVIVLEGVPLSDTNATAGTMAKFLIKSGGTTTEITGTVGTTGSDINFSGGVVVENGDTVQLTSLTITCPSGP